jgi:hypothetical protein
VSRRARAGEQRPLPEEDGRPVAEGLFVVVEVLIEADPLALRATGLHADVTIADDARTLTILHRITTPPVAVFVPAGLCGRVGHHAAAPGRTPRGAAVTAAPGRATIRRTGRTRATIIAAGTARAARRTAVTTAGAARTTRGAAVAATAAAAAVATTTAAAAVATTAAAFAATVTATTTAAVATATTAAAVATTAAAFAATVTATTTAAVATTAATVAAATLTRRATTIARGTARAARATGTARSPRGPLFSGAHVHTTTAEARAVHRLHRRLRVLIVFKGHEPEATGLAGLPIDDDRRLRDGPKGLERFTQLTLACGPREPADEQPVSHLLALLFQGGPFRANLITHSKP